MAKETIKWSEHLVFGALRKYYPEEAYALLPQVRSATGFSSSPRTADALVCSLWPSRGLWLQGIEIKVSRSDWLSELRKPAKSQAIQKYCHYWVVATPPGIVEDGEMPETWGHLIVGKTRSKMAIKPPRLTETPLSIEFMASVLRSVAAATVPTATLQEAIEDKVAAARISIERQLKYKYDSMEKKVAAFENASGVSLDNQWRAGDIGKIVKTIQELRLQHTLEYTGMHFDAMEKTAQRVLDTVSQVRPLLSQLDQAREAAELAEKINAKLPPAE